VGKKILITPRSFGAYKHLAYPLIEEQGYEIIENTSGRTLTEDEIINLAGSGVVGIIVGIDPLPARVLEACRDLKAISKYGMGLDNIDLDKAKELNIKIDRAAGTNNISVAELAIALMFSMARHVPYVSNRVKEGCWDRVMGCEVFGKKLGLVGCGLIGREVLKRALGLGMKVLVYDPYMKDDEIFNNPDVDRCSSVDELCRESDFVSLHAPLTEETRNIINKQRLELMKPAAILINTSRGELIDEDALYQALADKKIRGAAQDVFSTEPPDKDEKLLKLDNFILTSHIGAYTREAVERMVLVSAKNLLRMLAE
jgi:D-3-phosphoglycerate dehydrogenase